MAITALPVATAAYHDHDQLTPAIGEHVQCVLRQRKKAHRICRISRTATTRDAFTLIGYRLPMKPT
jgi:hypothetical protein